MNSYMNGPTPYRDPFTQGVDTVLSRYGSIWRALVLHGYSMEWAAVFKKTLIWGMGCGDQTISVTLQTCFCDPWRQNWPAEAILNITLAILVRLVAFKSWDLGKISDFMKLHRPDEAWKRTYRTATALFRCFRTYLLLKTSKENFRNSGLCCNTRIWLQNRPVRLPSHEKTSYVSSPRASATARKRFSLFFSDRETFSNVLKKTQLIPLNSRGDLLGAKCKHIGS